MSYDGHFFLADDFSMVDINDDFLSFVFVKFVSYLR